MVSPTQFSAARASAKREALLNTAENLFARQGYRAVGIDTLLAEAGVAKMTLYKQFGSKEELIAAVLERLAGTITSGLSQRLTAATWTSPIPSGWLASCTCCSKVSW